jgi:Family of unknown function (DUF6159)
MEQLGRSWDLLKSCFGILRSDKELLLFPILSGVAGLLVMALFAVPLMLAGLFERGFMPFNLIVFFLFYLCQAMVIFYFNAALVGAALIRLEGGNPSFGDGIRIANAHAMPIFGFAAISATVGILLRSGRRKRGLASTMGKLAGLAWSIATTLVLPLIVSRPIGPLDAIAESTRLLKKTWGENILGAVGIWAGFKAVMFVYVIASVAIVFTGLKAAPQLGIGLALFLLAGLLALIILKSAISAIYTAVLYRYAAEGSAPQGFEPQQLDLAFSANRA